MTTYAERPWLRSYDKDVPASLEPYPDKALHDLMRDSARQNPSREILLTSVRLPVAGRQGSAMTLGQLDRASDALGTALIDLGLQKGDRVAIILPTSTAFAITYYAVLKVGGVVAACNPTYPPVALAEQINDCDAEIAVVLSPFYETAQFLHLHTKLRTIIVTNIKEYFPPLGRALFTLAREKKSGHYVKELAQGDVWFQDLLKRYDGEIPTVAVSGNDIALYQYTGGTTGTPKGVMARHRGLVANMLQLKAWTASLYENPDDPYTILGALPMFHVYGLVAMLSYSVAMGGKIALVPNPRDIDELVDVIAEYHPTTFSGVPALFSALTQHPRIQSGEVSLRSLRFCSSGSAPLPSAVQDAMEQLIDVGVSEGFGMSEAPTATHLQPVKGEKRKGSIGLPLMDMDMRIVSLDDGVTDVPVGEIGELVMAGPLIMHGYHKMPTETANVLREKGGKTWLYTGDIARMDEDGYFYVLDRKKDMGIIGGFKVYPANIERVLQMHEAILDTAVAAIPHPAKPGQEAVKAWVVFKQGRSASEEDLIEHCSAFLPPYEIPRRFAFVSELPRSGVGKILRRELIQLELEERKKLEMMD